MKLTKTIAVVGLLAMSSTAANASTFGLGGLSYFNPSISSSQSSGSRAAIAQSLFNRFATNVRSNTRARTNARVAVRQLQDRWAQRIRRDRGSSASEVPLPASGLLLVGALGALALRRRRKS